MIPEGSITYDSELTSLINLIKSNTPQGERIIEVLKSSDEREIRRMLKNFGNPYDSDWMDITAATPWTDWQIDQAISDLDKTKPQGIYPGFFWAWAPIPGATDKI